jgi:hypothetical protein
MDRQYFLSSQRNGSVRNVFAFAILLIAGFGFADTLRAQSEVLNASRAPDASDGGLRAHIAALPSAPTPNVESAPSGMILTQSQIQIATERRHAFYSLDWSALAYGLVQGAQRFSTALRRATSFSIAAIALRMIRCRGCCWGRVHHGER